MSDSPRRTRRKRRRAVASSAVDVAVHSTNQQPAPGEHPAKQPRIILAIAATAATGGLALSGTNHGEVGRWISLGGLLLLIYGIHTFGRLGEDGSQG